MPASEIHQVVSFMPVCKVVLLLFLIAIANLSRGPVAADDSINYTNVERIMKCCRHDGLIVKPDQPRTTINALISGGLYIIVFLKVNFIRQEQLCKCISSSS